MLFPWLKPTLEYYHGGLQFRWKTCVWKLRYNLFCLFLVSFLCLINLGFWQLSKAKLLQEKQTASLRPIQPLVDTLLQAPASNWLAKKVSLSLETSPPPYTILLENQPKEGFLGYRVFFLAPLPQSTQFILIDRGWLAAPSSRQILPDIPALAAPPLYLQGHLYAPWKNPIISSPSDKKWQETDRVIRIQSLDLDYLEGLWHHPLAKAILKLGPDVPETLSYLQEEQWLSPERHQGYAFQWFGLACTLLIASIAAGLTRKKLYDA